MSYLYVQPRARNTDAAIRELVALAKALHAHRTGTIGDLPNEDIRIVTLLVEDLTKTVRHEFSLGDQLGVESRLNDVMIRVTHESDAEALIDTFGITRVIMSTNRLPYTPLIGPRA